MSLPSRPILPVPEDTAAVAHAAFRRGNPYMTLRDHLGPLFADASFAALYGNEGPPAHSPGCMATVMLLQYAEGLSDRAAAEAVRGRIDWKYLLGLSLTDDGFDASILGDFRDRVIAGGAEEQVLTQLLAVFREHELLRAGGKQRTDSTHVLAAVRTLNRLELVAGTLWVPLRHTLNVLATVAPAWLRATSDPAWPERYSLRIEGNRMPKTVSKRAELAAQIGRDGAALLAAIDDPETPAHLRTVEAVQTLRQVWEQEYRQDDDGMHWRETKELPAGATQICSPYDTDARYSEKRDTTWVGYKQHITEVCEPERPSMIVQVETTEATVPDCQVTERIQTSLIARDLAPEEQYVDSGFIDIELVVGSTAERGITLIGPLQPDNSWQARAGAGYDQSHFQIDWEQQAVRCPQGNTSSRWKDVDDYRGGRVIQVHFRPTECGPCPARELCTKADRRSLSLPRRKLYEALQAARAWQQTDAFKAAYKCRSGIEGTFSQQVRRSGLRHARYRGIAKVRLQHLITASAINLIRAAAWLKEVPRAHTRQSTYARLMASAA